MDLVGLPEGGAGGIPIGSIIPGPGWLGRPLGGIFWPIIMLSILGIPASIFGGIMTPCPKLAPGGNPLGRLPPKLPTGVFLILLGSLLLDSVCFLICS